MANSRDFTLKRKNGDNIDILYPTTRWAQVEEKPTTFTPTSHSHGNITNGGAIGSTANLMVKTGTSGKLTTLPKGTTSQFLRGDGTWATPADATTLTSLGITATSTELNYTDGVTSNIQTQLNSKLNLSGGTMTGSITMGSNNITGNNSSIFQAGRIIATNSNSNAHGITSKGSRANMLYLMNGVTGGLAASLLDVDVNNGTTAQERIAKIGIYGDGKSGTGGTPIAHYLWLSAVKGNAWNQDATLKVDSQNRVGIAISGTNRPTQSLDVNGKIRMRTATVDADGSDIVVTKGYMLSKIQTDTNNYLTNVSGFGNGTVTFTREKLSPLTWDASHSHTWSSITDKPVIPTKVSDLTNDRGFITIETDPIFTAWDKSTGISITKSQVSDLIAATKTLPGLMSATDKTRLDALHALLEEDTANNVVDSINEVLAIFNNYPEGADLVTALAGKVDKVTGKGLSTNDYTTTEKNKLVGIASGAEVNVQSDWNETSSSSDAFIKNKPDLTSWTQVWSGSVNLNSYTDSYYSATVPSNTYIGKRIAIEVQYGTDTTYTSKIIFGVLGNSSVYSASPSINRGIGWSYFDGTNLRVKTLYAYATSTATRIYVGHLKTLFGSFTGSTIEWSTSHSETLYMNKIWVIE